MASVYYPAKAIVSRAQGDVNPLYSSSTLVTSLFSKAHKVVSVSLFCHSEACSAEASMKRATIRLLR